MPLWASIAVTRPFISSARFSLALRISGSDSSARARSSMALYFGSLEYGNSTSRPP